MRTREFFSRLGAACALMLFLCLNAAAQSPGTRVEGVVQDQTGAAVVRAEVTLRDGGAVLARGATDSDGRFRLETPTPAAARLSVRAEGFAPFESGLDEVRTNLL